MKKKILVGIVASLMCIACLTGCGSDDSSTNSSSSGEGSSLYDETGFAMGTVVNQTIYSDDKALASEVINLLTQTEEKYISWRVEGSDISKINSNALSGTPTEVSEQTAVFIVEALEIADNSEGAFDPTIGRLSRLWDFENNPTDVPSENKITDVMKSIGYKNIAVEGSTVNINNKSSIDLGAMGKGIGCDQVQSFLEARDDVSGYLLNIGGSSILTFGKKDDGEPWRVAVINPRDDENYLGAISLEGTNHVSTSGDYERYFEKNGVRYHHILDPSTGYPADSGLMSVTVVTDNGANCDALSTACFVLGMNKAEKLLEKYGAEAVFVDADKNVHVTEGLKTKFELISDQDYKLN